MNMEPRPTDCLPALVHKDNLSAHTDIGQRIQMGTWEPSVHALQLAQPEASSLRISPNVVGIWLGSYAPRLAIYIQIRSLTRLQHGWILTTSSKLLQAPGLSFRSRARDK